MKISIPAILAAAMGTQSVLADYAIFYTNCIGGCHSDFMCIDAFGYYGMFNGNEGCRPDPGPPGMLSACFDWGNRRAHFYYINQPKRCLVQKWSRDPEFNHALAQWDEVGCTW